MSLIYRDITEINTQLSSEKFSSSAAEINKRKGGGGRGGGRTDFPMTGGWRDTSRGFEDGDH